MFMKAWNKDKTKKEFDELLLEVRRVTRVTTWWRRMSFRATVLVWNKKGKIWLWTSKGADVSIAVSKASREAYKTLKDVPMTKDNTVPYETQTKYKACVIKLLPAKAGTGLKAWSAVRAVLELAWYENILSKIIWSNNKLNNAFATIQALTSYKHAEHFWKKLVKKSKEEDKVESVETTEAPKAKHEVKKEVAVEAKAEAKHEVKKPVAKKAPAKK